LSRQHGPVLPGQPPSAALRIEKPAKELAHSRGGVTAVPEVSWRTPTSAYDDERLQKSEMPVLVGGASGSPRMITDGAPQAEVIHPSPGNTLNAPGDRITIFIGMMSTPATTAVPK